MFKFIVLNISPVWNFCFMRKFITSTQLKILFFLLNQFYGIRDQTKQHQRTIKKRKFFVQCRKNIYNCILSDFRQEL